MRIGLDGRAIQDHFPGIGRYAYELARHLSLVAGDGRLAVLYDPAAPNTRYDLEVLNRQDGVETIPVRPGVFDPRAQVLLPRLGRELRLDVYHSPYYAMAYGMPCPTIVTLHDLVPLLVPGALPVLWRRWAYGALVRLAARRSAHIIVDSEAARADVLRLLGPSPDRVSVVPLGVGQGFRDAAHSSSAETLARLGVSRPYLLYVGSDKPHKNLGALVEAWVGLPQGLRAGHELVLAGPSNLRRAPAAARAGDDRSVRILGPVPEADLPALYAGARAMVYPSLSEGFGLPVLEAMAAGTAVACADVPALKEVADDAALLFDPRDQTSIRSALSALLADKALCARLSEAGRRRAARFTWERTAERTLDVYHRVAGERRAAA